MSRTRKQILEYASRYAKANRSKITERTKKYYEEHVDKYLHQVARKRAKKFGIEFDLEPSDIVVPDVCPILGEPLVRYTRYAPSLDRIDSSKGYTKDNVMVISWKANTMKSDANVADLKKFADWVNKTFV